MGTNPAWVPGNNPVPPSSVRSAKDIAAGLRALENAARGQGVGDTVNQEIIVNRLLGPGLGQLILDLQTEGKMPPFGSPEWTGMIELAERGQVAIAPVILIGPTAYACDVAVYERIRHGPERDPDEGEARPAPARPGRDAPPARPAAPVSLASEISSWG